MDEMLRVKMHKTLLGRLFTDVQIVVITPIVSAFHKLNEKLGASEVNKDGFFHNSCFQTISGLTGMLIRIPQGIGAQDVMYALSNVDVWFFGYAGSLSKEIPIGTIVEVKTAIQPDGTQCPLKTTGAFDKVICGYSPCLLGNMASDHCEKARSAGCQVVDMETVYCAYAAMQNMNRFTAQLVVSDIPGSINFWELNKENKAIFKQNSAAAVDHIVACVNV